MEFSIQKIRRCGKSALRSHRREAARVVFFTIFLPFLLLLLLGVNLYHNIPGTFIGQNEKAVWIFAGIAAVVFLFFYLPLWLGAKRWYLETCRPGRLRIPSVFYYFSSFRLYGKAVVTGLHLAFCQTVLLLLGILPGSGTAVISVVMFRWSDHDLGRSLSLLCLLAGASLLLCGIAWAKYIGRRYFWVPWLLAADPSAPSRWIFGEASRLCREKRGIWEDIYRRLWWPRLLSLGIIPAFWALPIVDCTLVLWLSEQLPIYEKSSVPTSFRQRKIRHFSAGKIPFPAEKQEIPV